MDLVKDLKPVKWVSVLCAVGLLASCADKQVILPGERLAARASAFPNAVDINVSEIDGSGPVQTGFSAFETTKNSDWTHRAGNAGHYVSNPAFSTAPSLVWSANIGEGNSRKYRITSQPIIAGNQIYTLDSRSRVTALTTSGATVWTADVTLPGENSKDASGGGLAFAEGRIFATTGFGEVVALDAKTGAIVWRQNLNAPATASPTVVDGLVYAVSRDNRAWAIDTKNGRIKWELPGTPDVSGIVGGASPAVTDRVAIFPFGSGELVAALRQGGVRLWGSAVSGKRQGRAYANISDITADPVVVGDVIYTGNQSGRAVALSLSSGTRLWTARDGAYGPVSVGGGSVFMISDQSELIRLDAATGNRIWGVELPFFKRDKARRAKAIFAHYGPMLAGNTIWVASDNGTLKSYDPATGAERSTVTLPGGAASEMSVAGGTMYILSGKGQLHAFR